MAAFQPEDESGGSIMKCGKWQLEREIGQGAYGTVYLAVGPGGERAAVKVCRRDAVGDERYARELRGAKLYRAIPHQEGLVRMSELVETEWGFYAVMDLADDEFASDGAASPGRAASPFAAASGVYRPKTLASVIEGEKALPLGECVKLGIALAKGLVALQRHHLLHRDIKPGNVIYVGGKPVLSDPGLVVEESEAASLVGTPGYVPPEKFTDAASDIYSLGLTLKAASFGRKLEDLDKGPALEADTNEPLFPAWWRILNKATNPTPSRRYQSAKAFLKELKALRFKMAVTSKLGSRKAKTTIIAASIGIVVYVGIIVLNNERMRTEVAAQKKEIARQRKEMSAQHERVDRQNTEMSAQREQIDRQNRNMTALREQIDRQNTEMSAQREQIDRQNRNMTALREQIDRQNTEMSVHQKQIDRQSKEISSYREEIACQQEKISSQSKEIGDKLDEITRQRNEIARQQETIKSQSKEINDKIGEIDRQRDEIASQRRVIDQRAQEVTRQAKEITGQIEAHALLTGNETNLVSELQSLRQFKTDTEKMMAKAERESLWPIYASIWNFDRYPEQRVRDKRKGIAEIAVTNKTCAAELQAQLDRLLELDKQTCNLVRQISALREKAKEKVKNGQDDGDEYRQAKELYHKRIGISKECKSIFNKLPSSSGRASSYDIPRLLNDVEDRP